MNIEGKGCLMKIYVGETDEVNGRPLYEEIVFSARNAGLAGASVFKGILSFGASHSIHTVKTPTLPGETSVLIEIVDTNKNITAFCPVLYKMMDESKKGGLVILQKVSILRYRKDQKYNEFTTF
jgi:uncharacterized protein